MSMLARSVTPRNTKGYPSKLVSNNLRGFRQWKTEGTVWKNRSFHSGCFVRERVFRQPEEQEKIPLDHPFSLQLRWKRKDGYSSFFKVKPMTRKKQKMRNRKMVQQRWEKEGKHSAPGSKAGPRREWADFKRQQYLTIGDSDEDDPTLLEYDYGDALLDDLIGNTNEYTSTPTPKPQFLGHKHQKYYDIVSNKMKKYRESLEKLKEQEQSGDPSKALLDLATLPSDRSISLVLRAYRDLHGTRSQPVGIAKALEHLLKDLSLPTTAFGEETYTALLTCCRTPKEARRIFRLMEDRQHPISAYSWSILVDIHAKLGDFQGCDAVVKEMVREGVAPTLPAYTSLLAGCYKVCNAGHIPPVVRDQAGKLAWERWKEMRVIGIEPDVMAYGALLRICAARGKPERALNILEEMQAMEVKPTTLCFTSALKAVARSHQTSVRFENGWSRKNRQREQITAHHGMLARQVVILAENAEIKQDDGFISALMLCAGAAGDSATAKAILLASEVRKLDHLRTTGSDSHLKSLRGETTQESNTDPSLGMKSQDVMSVDASAEGGDAVSSPRVNQEHHSDRQIEEEREYGNDTRVLSALMTSCSQAIDRGLGTMWAGRENKGYLCEDSLRRIKTRPQPRYMDNSIPGVSSMDVGLGAMEFDEEQPKLMSKKQLRRYKFGGMIQDESLGQTLDDIDDYFYQMFEDDDPAIIRQRERAKMLEGSNDDEELLDDDDSADPADGAVTAMFYDSGSDSVRELNKNVKSDHIADESPEEWFFDTNEMKWKTRARTSEPQPLASSTASHHTHEDDQTENNVVDDEEYYFDNDDMRWKTRPKIIQPALTAYEATALTEQDGSLVTMSRSQTNDDLASGTTKDDLSSLIQNENEFEEFVEMLKLDMQEGGEDFDLDKEEVRDLLASVGGELHENTENESVDLDKLLDRSEDDNLVGDDDKAELVASGSAVNVVKEQDPVLMELEAILPGMPLPRLARIRNAFRGSLSHPSLLVLTPLVRENMPDDMTPEWLRYKNLENAGFCVQKAAEDDAVDLHMLNGMLQVATAAGGIDRALHLYNEEFQKYQIAPSQYSNRLMLQMLIKNNRPSRALQLKEEMEARGQRIDALTYGSFIDHYSRHHQVGSALIMLKECVAKHGAPPNEKSLTRLRLLCRQRGLKRLNDELAGKDPLEWLRHGEANLKREMSYRGKRDVLLAKNRAVQI